MGFTKTDENIDVDTDSLVDLDWKHVPPCEAEYEDGTECDNEADFIAEIACCGGKILVCEDCFFEAIEYMKMHEGEVYTCAMCNSKIELSPFLFRVVGRV